MQLTTVLAYIFGALVVFTFCIRYFNMPSYSFGDDKQEYSDDADKLIEPAMPKYMTNRAQYNMNLILFISVTEVIYLILAKILPFLPGGDYKALDQATFALLSALIISGFAPNLPVISKLIDDVKRYLHKMAQIPRKGQDIYRILRSRKIKYCKEKINEIVKDDYFKQFVLKSDFEKDQGSLLGKWIKINYFIFHLRFWQKESPLKNYIYEPELRWQSIKKSFHVVRNTMQEYRNGNLNEDEKASLHLKLDALLLRIYRLLSCLLFIGDKKGCEYSIYLEQLGYEHSPNPVFSLQLKSVFLIGMASIAGIIVGAIFSGLLTYSLGKYIPWLSNVELNLKNIKVCILYGTPFLTIPVVLVLLIKRYLSFQEDTWPVKTFENSYKKIQERPWHIYTAVSFLSYIVGLIILVIVLIINIIYNKSILTNLYDYIATLAIWSQVIFVTSFFVAYWIDTPLFKDKKITFSSGFTNFIYGCFEGLVIAVTIFFILCYLENNGKIILVDISDTLKAKFVSYPIMGFFIGFFLFMVTRLNMIDKDRRKYHRFSLKMPIDFKIGNKDFRGKVINVSKGGVLIYARNIIAEAGEQIKLTFQSNKTVNGKVIRFVKNKIHVMYDSEINLNLIRVCSLSDKG